MIDKKVVTLAEIKSECYCGKKSEEQCEDCGRKMHFSCTNSPKCHICTDKHFELLFEFYEQYQSCYTDFSTCFEYLKPVLSKEKSHQNSSKSEIEAQPKTWLIKRDLMSTNYARLLMLQKSHNDQKDLSQVIKGHLILQCLNAAQTGVRQKCLKTLKN